MKRKTMIHARLDHGFGRNQIRGALYAAGFLFIASLIREAGIKESFLAA